MTLHLIKLCVGAESLADLESWQQQRARRGQPLMHVTRNTPKRAADVLDGGSLYWVIKGFICARQRILDLQPLQLEGIPHCGIVYAPQIVRVRHQPRRAFQGWRYLEAKDAPPDLPQAGHSGNMPEAMMRELAELGLV